ncbi:MAG: hypothetical protein QOI34_447 [Verrucomicrobiota bacterium]|jgi:hypothetical protein
MIMRTIFVLIPVSFLAAMGFAADIIPKRSEFGRYQAMLDHSPFAVATAAALPAATPSFAKDLYIANAAKSSEGDMVTLASASDKNLKEYLTTKGPNEHGYAIANIEWSDKVGATKVTISKDGQFASITFNQALISQGPGVPSGPQPSSPVYPPAQMQPPAAAVGRPAMPNLPTPPPRVRGVIPRNPSVAIPPPMNVPPPSQAEDQ